MRTILDVFAKGFTSLACSSVVAFASDNAILGCTLAAIAFGVCCYRVLLGVAFSLYKAVKA